jgi:hypothetical protein
MRTARSYSPEGNKDDGPRVTVRLGRGDGMETVREYDAWMGFVIRHIDGRCGFEVGVEELPETEVQVDEMDGGTDGEQATVRRVLLALWEGMAPARIENKPRPTPLPTGTLLIEA